LIVTQTVNRSHPDGETTYAWSSDLINWSPPQTLFDRPNMSSPNCNDRYRYGYPSVLDADAPGRNFDQIGDHPYLFLTRFHIEDCHLPPDRDLLRFKLDITQP
jgi:hypothetical protein